jgi:hypothetical protein
MESVLGSCIRVYQQYVLEHWNQYLVLAYESINNVCLKNGISTYESINNVCLNNGISTYESINNVCLNNGISTWFLHTSLSTMCA